MVNSFQSLVYPNPGHSLTIHGKKGTYSIYDYPSMRFVSSGKNESNRIDISGLNAGTYLIEIDGVIYKFKKTE